MRMKDSRNQFLSSGVVLIKICIHVCTYTSKANQKESKKHFELSSNCINSVVLMSFQCMCLLCTLGTYIYVCVGVCTFVSFILHTCTYVCTLLKHFELSSNCINGACLNEFPMYVCVYIHRYIRRYTCIYVCVGVCTFV